MSPREEYTSRRIRWREEYAQCEASQRRLGTARLWTGILLAAVAAASLGGQWISAEWLAVPTGVLIVLVGIHPARERALRRAARLGAYYDRGLARLEHRWIGTGAAGDQWRPADHLYADDLDLFGRGSLFELLSVARTATGERTLAQWLLAPGEEETIRARQQAVAELAAKLDLREDLAVLGEDIRAALDDRQLGEWGARPAVSFFSGARVVAAVLGVIGGVAAVVAVITWAAGMTNWRPVFYAGIVEIGFVLTIRRSVAEVTGAVNTPARELRLIAALLERLERESFSAPALVAMHAGLQVSGASASAQIRRLQRLVEWKEWAHNQIFGILAAPMLWVPQFAMAIEAWRRGCGPHVAGWVATVGEFEALASLAAFTYERPGAVFPELVASSAAQGEPMYEVEALVHPLIAPAEAIANDVAVGGHSPGNAVGNPGNNVSGNARLWIVSGSNMSGKSTLLRAVGVSVVLAWAGAPVTARRLRLSRLALGASLRSNDSLADHRSRFFAEITRLKQIVDAAGAGQVLFLLDELLSGTNSHDRRIGAQALLESLLARGAIGLATTHDLALAEIAEGLGAVARNVHFEDQFHEGRLEWDYTLRAGVVERGNALALMRAVGLDV